MITISVMGGLGNQMFQYAAAKALAARHGVGVAIDVTPLRGDGLRSYLLDRLRIPEVVIADDAPGPRRKSAAMLWALKWRNRAERVFRRLGVRLAPQRPATFAEKHAHFDPEFFRQGPTIRLYGYFQSELYFADIADQIRALFQPRDPLGPQAQATADLIARSALPVSVHIRRGDYVSKPDAALFHGVLGEAYYRKALKILQGMVGSELTVFVFSDDPPEAERILDFLPRDRLVHVGGDPERPWEDMALMARCRHHVIANSSFSWWGAWLNPSPDKIVIGPRQWFAPAAQRRSNTCDHCPPDWILV